MKRLSILLAISLFISCAERENPVSTDSGFSIVCQLPPVGVFREIYVNGANSYIAADYMKVLKVDLSDPTSPTITDTLDDERIGVTNSVYFSESTCRLYVESVENPEHLAAFTILPDDSLQTDFFELSPPLTNFSVREFFHYEQDSLITDSIYVYASDPGESWKFTEQHLFPFGDAFELFSSNNYNGHKVYDFAIVDSLAFLAVDEFGLDIIDLNSGYNLQVIGSYDSEGFCRGIAVQNDYCYLADRHWGLRVLDISDPANPDLAATLQFEGADDCEKVRVLGNRAVVLDKYDGIFAVDISDPSNPQLLFNFDTITPTDVEITEDYIYVIDEDAGLVIAEW